MRILGTISAVALLAGIALTTTTIAGSSRAEAAKMCSHVVKTACIWEKGSGKHTSATNKCLARQWHAKILHWGPC